MTPTGRSLVVIHEHIKIHRSGALADTPVFEVNGHHQGGVSEMMLAFG